MSIPGESEIFCVWIKEHSENVVEYFLTDRRGRLAHSALWFSGVESLRLVLWLTIEGIRCGVNDWRNASQRGAGSWEHGAETEVAA